MTGYMTIDVENIGGGENKDALSNLVGGLEDGLKLGASSIKDGLNKTIKINKHFKKTTLPWKMASCIGILTKEPENPREAS